MSPATFHRQCKELTSFTPIQYQKRLRLYEAQQFLMRGDGDVNSAAFAVGYVSPQQVPRSFGAQWRHCGLFFPYVRIFCGRRLFSVSEDFAALVCGSSLKYPTIARQLTISISANTARHWPA